MILRSIIYSFTLSMMFFLYCPRTTSIHPDFLGAAKHFARVSGISLVDKNLTIDYGWADFLNEDAVAYCIPFTLPGTDITIHRKIIIDREYYNRSTIKQRELTIFHELEHCILDRDHDDRLREDGCPLSNMFYATAPDICIERHYKEYINEVKQ